MAKTVWDLTHLYKNNTEFEQDFEKAKKLLKNLEKFKNKLVKNDKKIILNYLLQDVELSLVVEKLAVYARTCVDENGKDDTNLKNYQQINSFCTEANKKLAFAKTEMSLLDDKFLRELSKDSNFSDFDRYFEEIIRMKKHTLSEKDEQFVASLSGFCIADDIYSLLTNIEMDHGEFFDENGKKIKLTTGNFNFYMRSASQDTRKRVLEEYLEKYGKFNLTIANLYFSHVKCVNFLAETYGYKSAREMFAYEEEVDPKIMLKNIERVSSRVKLLQKYFKVKQKLLGVDEFYVSDIFAELSAGDDSVLPYEGAILDIKNALAPLGKDYTEMFETAVNSGWIDVYPKENKTSGGYTISAYSCHPYILLNFDGTEYWKSAIAHEFGHAMHSYYSAKAQPYSKHNYTIFVAEVASLTNEILLSNYMLQKETDKQKKKKILSEFLQLFYLNVFNSTMMSEFEIFVHETLQGGEELSSNDLSVKFKDLCGKYFGKNVILNKNFEFDWCRKPHFFMNYYLYKYSTGLISACAVASKILSDNNGEYVKKYKKFLSLGGSVDPVTSLRQAEVDILSEKTYDLAFGLFENYLHELQKLANE